ncbi:hypothetical protein ACQKL5_21240 [Peribacillus sp. NPDC097675]|uniref:hypothetical protein n=1 Tax=Peribacillus sp. NPDC097675 TaxID=3390618 RepID=UPI003D0942A1
MDFYVFLTISTLFSFIVIFLLAVTLLKNIGKNKEDRNIELLEEIKQLRKTIEENNKK